MRLSVITTALIATVARPAASAAVAAAYRRVGSDVRFDELFDDKENRSCIIEINSNNCHLGLCKQLTAYILQHIQLNTIFDKSPASCEVEDDNIWLICGCL